MGLLRRYALGILPRYVIGQVAKAFLLALLTLTAVFVLVVVLSQVAEAGLGPREIVVLVPFAIPSTLPFTVPVALLFAVTVVYGRIASDNEILAVKAAGLGVVTVLGPSFVFGALLSGALLLAGGEFIPRANHAIRIAVLRNVEDMLYRILATEREFNNKAWPFKINVREVKDRTLLDAHFAHRDKAPDALSPFDVHVYAERAKIHFDEGSDALVVDLTNAEFHGDPRQPQLAIVPNQQVEIPLPRSGGPQIAPPPQELTTATILSEQAECRAKSREGRDRQVVTAALWIASGRPGSVDWLGVRQAFRDHAYLEGRYKKLETEKQFRQAIAFSPLFFVLVGAPVGIWRARGDFLSAFMMCFLPILVIYYPMLMFGINAGKEGLLGLPPWLSLWLGNFTLGLLSGWVMRPVLKH